MSFTDDTAITPNATSNVFNLFAPTESNFSGSKSDDIKVDGNGKITYGTTSTTNADTFVGPVKPFLFYEHPGVNGQPNTINWFVVAGIAVIAYFVLKGIDE